MPTHHRQKKEIVNKVALITGSSKGIGRAIAIELAKNDIDVVVNNKKDFERGMEVVDVIKKIGQRAIYIQADVSDPDQVEKMIKKVIIEFGRIDILVNNAGIVIDKMLENMDIDQWNKVISVNLTGTFNCTKSVIKHMQKKGGGKIINISSIVGEIGNIGQSNYSASKGGIISFTKSIAKEYARDGIIVNAIAPGFIDTEMTRKIPENIKSSIVERIPMGRFGTPEEIADVVLFLCNASYITGTVIDVNGGIT